MSQGSEIKVEYIDHSGSDLSVANAARVSFNKESDWDYLCLGDCAEHGGAPSEECCYCECKLSDRDSKLINYLAKHKHYSPFGHCFASFRVTAPVFVSRQLVKHKFLRINEISRRYVDEEPEFYVPDVWRSRAENKKQGSGGPLVNEEYGSVQDYFNESYGEFQRYAEATYEEMIRAGVAPEQARMILPQSMMTSWIWSGSLDAFFNMCHLRIKDDAQHETRVVAEMVGNILFDLYPISWEALSKWTN